MIDLLVRLNGPGNLMDGSTILGAFTQEPDGSKKSKAQLAAESFKRRFPDAVMIIHQMELDPEVEP